MGDPRDFDLQRRLIDATRNGDFEPAIEGVIERYREDTIGRKRRDIPFVPLWQTAKKPPGAWLSASALTYLTLNHSPDALDETDLRQSNPDA